MLIKIIVLIFFIESVTNIISKSVLFLPVRKFMYNNCTFIHDLLDCPYCTSVWVSFVGCVFTYFDNIILNFIMYIFCFHRLSNILHSFIDYIQYKLIKEKEMF